MNILVTGANGFVGRNLVENLKAIRDGKNRTRPNLNIADIYEYDLDSTLEELRTFETRRKLRNARPDLPIPEDEGIDDDPVPFWLLDRGWTYDTDVYPNQLPEKE